MVIYVKAKFIGRTSYFTINYLVCSGLARMVKAWGRQKYGVAAIGMSV
jgi:hypothetical protein